MNELTAHLSLSAWHSALGEAVGLTTPSLLRKRVPHSGGRVDIKLVEG